MWQQLGIGDDDIVWYTNSCGALTEFTINVALLSKGGH